MAKIVMEEYEEWPTLPVDSIVLCKVDSTSVEDVPGRNGSWQKLKFVFKILGIQVAGDGGPTDRYDKLLGEKLYGDVSFTFNDSPENKLRQWASAILNIDITDPGFELDTDYFDGRQVRAVTIQYDKKAMNPSTGQPYKGHKVGALLPAQGGGFSTQSSVAAAAQNVAAPDPWASSAQAQPVTAGAAPEWDAPPF